MPTLKTPTLADFPVLRTIGTRWTDNDMFGHLNNAVYFQLFDTAINGWLAEQTGTAPLDQAARGVVAEVSCRYFAEIGFPDPVVVGIAVERLGTKSVTYSLGIFRERAGDTEVAALARWVHVYVDPASKVTVPIPPTIRSALEALSR